MLIVIAFLAGIISTVAGMGGGTLLVMATALLSGSPMMALAASSIGLLAGDAHRLWMFRTSVHRRLTRSFVLGALPMAILGGVVATQLPVDWVRIAIAVVGLLAVAAIGFGLRIHPPKTATTATGALVGALSSTTGGGGMLAGPFLLASGLTANTYIATTAACASVVHVGRLIGYGTGGAISADVAGLGLAYAVAIPVGNVVGGYLRDQLPARASRPLELGTVGIVASLALATAW